MAAAKRKNCSQVNGRANKPRRLLPTIAAASTSAPLPQDRPANSTPTGGTIYDFEWDQTSQTLAVVDYTNRNVSIFSTAVPEPSTTLAAGVCTVGLAGLMLRGRRREQDA